MMDHKSNLLLRTQSTLRLFEKLSEGHRKQLAFVKVELELIERVLTQVNRASDKLFEDIALEVLEAVLTAGLGAITAVTEEEEQH